MIDADFGVLRPPLVVTGVAVIDLFALADLSEDIPAALASAIVARIADTADFGLGVEGDPQFVIRYAGCHQRAGRAVERDDGVVERLGQDGID